MICTINTIYIRNKFANVTPVFEKDSPCNGNNYRPISLISIIGKIMERCVYEYIHNYLLANRIITPHHSGFTRGKLTKLLINFYSQPMNLERL